MKNGNALKKQNGYKSVGIFLILSILIATICVYGWAKYISPHEGNTSAEVARWYFDVTVNGNALDSEEIDFALTRDANDTDSVARGKIAPGTYGKFEIVVDLGDTDVLATYNIIINLEDCPTNLKFYMDSGAEGSRQELRKIRISTEDDEDEEAITMDELAISRHVPLGENGEHVETIYWEWPFETGNTEEEKSKNNIEDSKWINKEKMIMQISATGFQVMEHTGDTSISFVDTEFAFANPYNITKQDVEKIYTLDTNYVPDRAISTSWDISESQNGAIMVYALDEDNNGKYEIYIGQVGGVDFGSDYSSLFSEYTNATYMDVSNVITNNVTSMYNIFGECENLKEICGLQNWNTANVKSMQGMFKNCSSLEVVDTSKLNTSNVITMYDMFYHCSSLRSLDVSNFNTAKVSSMRNMFCSCNLLETLDVSGFDTSKCTNMYNMFRDCSSVLELDVSNFDTSKAVNMYYMFSDCSSIANLDVSNFNTSKVTTMYSMFRNCSSLTSLNVSNFDTSRVVNMNNMFSGCSSLTSLDVSNFNTSRATTMRHMFYYCSGITSLDVSGFATTNVTSMDGMFAGCTSLANLNVGNFDTRSVTSMYCMFYGCSALTSIDVSNFNTTKVKDMSSMFRDCKLLTSIDVSKFNTTNVTGMGSMFRSCTSLTNLDISNFDISSVTSMYYMFNGCSALTSIGVNKEEWLSSLSNDVNTSSIFGGCTLLH